MVHWFQPTAVTTCLVLGLLLELLQAQPGTPQEQGLRLYRVKVNQANQRFLCLACHRHHRVYLGLLLVPPSHSLEHPLVAMCSQDLPQASQLPSKGLSPLHSHNPCQEHSLSPDQSQ